MAKWLHVGRYAVGNEPRGTIPQVENPIPKPPAVKCPDKFERCEGWSLAGECYKNPIWMVGNVTHPGNCLGSCIRCDIHEAHLKLQEQESKKAAVATS